MIMVATRVILIFRLNFKYFFIIIFTKTINSSLPHVLFLLFFFHTILSLPSYFFSLEQFFFQIYRKKSRSHCFNPTISTSHSRTTSINHHGYFTIDNPRKNSGCDLKFWVSLCRSILQSWRCWSRHLTVFGRRGTDLVTFANLIIFNYMSHLFVTPPSRIVSQQFQIHLTIVSSFSNQKVINFTHSSSNHHRTILSPFQMWFFLLFWFWMKGREEGDNDQNRRGGIMELQRRNSFMYYLTRLSQILNTWVSASRCLSFHSIEYCNLFFFCSFSWFFYVLQNSITTQKLIIYVPLVEDYGNIRQWRGKGDWIEKKTKWHLNQQFWGYILFLRNLLISGILLIGVC